MLSRIGTPHLLVCSTFLVLSGLVMVYSASALNAEVSFGNPWVYFWRQLTGLALGVIAALIMMRTPLDWVRRGAYLGWVIAAFAVVATLTPLGIAEKGAQRWLNVGGLIVQPLEVVKLAVIIALARWLAGKQADLRDYRVAVMVPLLIAGIPALLLLFQPDFGGAMILFIFAGTMMFVAGARLTHMAATGFLLLPVIVVIAFQPGYREARFQSFIDPWADHLGRGYQVVQSFIAFGSGGLTGTGLGASQQKLGYLPEAHTDFILSIVGEEVGLLGVITLLVCLLVLAIAAIGIAFRARDTFSMLLAVGASLMIWLQGLVNAGVAMGVLPTKGTTLPLFSYGRSSLVMSLAAVGLILNVARPRKRGRKGWR
jgi:cell division protein FtsW